MANGYIGDFPSLYTPGKKKELQYIQREFAGITGYSKRLEETWRARPAVERWGLAGLAQLPLPWAAREHMPEALETLRWGYTPEQVRERAMVIGEERQELLRQKKVTTDVNRIVNHLLYLASIGTPVKTEEELKVKFPEIDTDWSDEDIEWLVKSTLEIAGMSTDEIKQQMTTGAFVPTEEVETPVDWEAVAAFYKKQRREDPSLIAATLAFEQDASVIKHGLEDLFRPTGVTMTPAEQEAQIREATKEMFPELTEEEIDTRIVDIENLQRDMAESDILSTLTDVEGKPVDIRIEADGMVYDESGEEVGFFDEDTGEFTPTTTTGGRIASGALTVVSAVGRGIEFIDRPFVMPMYANDVRGKDPKDRTLEEQLFLDLHDTEYPQQALSLEEYTADARERGLGRVQAERKLPQKASPELVKAFEDAVPMWKWIAYSLLNPIWWIIPGGLAGRTILKAGQIAVRTGLSKPVVRTLLKTLGWKGSRGLTSQRAIQLAAEHGLISQHDLYMLSARQVLNQGKRLSYKQLLAVHGGRLARVALIPPALVEGTLSAIPKTVGWIATKATYAIARGRIERALTNSFVRHLGEAEAKVRLEELAKVLQVDIPKLGENASTDDMLKAVAVAIHDAMRHIRSEPYARKYASNYAKELGDAMLIDATGGVAPEVAAKTAWIQMSRGTTANTEKFVALMDRVVTGEVLPAEITADFITKEFPDLIIDKEFVQFLRKYLVDSGAIKAAEVVVPIEARTTTEIAEAVSKLIGKEAEQVNLADVIRLHYSGDEATAIEKAVYELYSRVKVGKEMTILGFKTVVGKVLGKPDKYRKAIDMVYEGSTWSEVVSAKILTKSEAKSLHTIYEKVFLNKRLLGLETKEAFMKAVLEEAGPVIPKLEATPEITDAFTRDTLDFLGIHKVEKGMLEADVLTEGLRRMAVDINQAKIYGSATLEAEEALAEVYLRRDPALFNATPKAPDFASVPDGSVDIGILSLGGREIPWGKFLDTDHFVMRLATKTGTPALHRSYMRIYYGRQASAAMQNAFHDTVYKNSAFRGIARDDKALNRVTQYIRHQNPRLAEAGVTLPEGITTAEKELANVLMDLYRSYETKVRYIRFWLAYDRSGGSIKQIMKSIPGTTEAEITEACRILQQEGRVPLEEYLSKQTWGTIGSGYDPWLLSGKAGIMAEPSRVSFPRTGIETRVGVEFEQMDRDILQRTATYIRDIEFDYMMLPEIKRFDAILGKVSPKLTPKARGYVTNEMTRDLQHMKGTFRGSDAYRFAMRIYSQAMAGTFWNPRLAFRNCFQIYAFYPERAKLFKYGFMGMGAQDEIFYKEIVSQLSGVTKDLMFRGQRAFPGLDAVTRFANKTSAYPHSDDVFRKLCFTGSMNQAREAGDRYLLSGKTYRDVDRLIADSGLIHLEEGVRRVAHQKLTAPESSYIVKGLENVNSLDAFAYEVGKAITDMVHFKYTRALRAPIEHGEAGVLLFNLFTFPRSYGQRIAFKLGKLNPKAEVSIAERVAAWKDIQNIMIVGSFVGWTFKKISGSRFNPYTPWNIIQWQPGGLALGAVAEIAQTPVDMFIVATESLGELWGASTGDSVAKEAAVARLTTKAPRTMRLFVPMWKESLGVLEALVTAELPGVEKIPWSQDLDINFIRWARSKLEEDYDPKYTEEIERDLIENYQHAMFRSVPPDPTKFEESQTELNESEAKLSTRDEEGHLWTLKDFGSDVTRVARTMPIDLIDESYGFSELAMARMHAEDIWQEYKELPDYPSDNKSAYLTEHPEVDAWLFFWGEVKILQSEEAIINVMVLCRYYGITQEMHGTLISEPAIYKEEREEWEMQLYEYNEWQTPEDILNWRSYGKS